MLSFAIFLTHGLAGYVAIDITWTEYVSDSIKNHPRQTFFNYLIRTSVVLVTCEWSETLTGSFRQIIYAILSFAVLLAIAVPNLDLFISLFGALCLSTLGFAFPAIIECATYWNHMKGGSRMTLLLKDASLVMVGVVGLVVGTYTSMAEIIRSFSE